MWALDESFYLLLTWFYALDTDEAEPELGETPSEPHDGSQEKAPAEPSP